MGSTIDMHSDVIIVRWLKTQINYYAIYSFGMPRSALNPAFSALESASLTTRYWFTYNLTSGEVAGGAGGAVAPPAGLKKGAPKLR